MCENSVEIYEFMRNVTVGRKDEKWSTSFGLKNLIPFSSLCPIGLANLSSYFNLKFK